MPLGSDREDSQLANAPTTLHRHRGALLDLAEWAQVDVAGDEPDGVIVARVLAADAKPLETLSLRGLRLLAALSGLRRVEHDSRRTLLRRIRRARGWRASLRTHRRRIMGSVLSRLLHGETDEPRAQDELRANRERVKQRIQDAGVVGGLTGELRGAADTYIADKLDEIELRINRKLDEIDLRLRAWRDREVAVRLKLLKMTLVVSILVALISLGYDYWRPQASATANSAIHNVADGEN